MTYWCPTVECKNPSCEFRKQLPIFLPYPVRLEAVVSHPDWPPNDWKASITCRNCGHLYEYNSRDVIWGQCPDGGPWEHNQFLRAELQCTCQNCEFPVVVHMFAEKGIPHNMLEEKLFEPSKTAVCEKGCHPAQPMYVRRLVGVTEV